jgi:hypothetical protein
MVELLQKGHGGWEDTMAKVIISTDLHTILAYYLDKTTLISLLY